MTYLLIITGISFAGKTTLGNAIAKHFGYEQVDVDVTKVRLYGPNVKDELLSQCDWDKIYDETDRTIVELLQSGKTVIDASRNFSKRERQHIRNIIYPMGMGVVTIYVDTPEVVARQRLRENRKIRTRVDLSDSDFDAVINAMEPPEKEEDSLIFHYEDDLEKWITEHIPFCFRR